MRVEIYLGSFYTWLPYIAYAKGFFARNGLDATIVGDTGGGPVAFAALASGSADVAMGDLTLAGPYLERGVGLTAISGAVKAGWELVAPKGSTLPTSFPALAKALQGKTVGVVGLGSSSYYYVASLLQAAGVPTSSVSFAAVGGLPADFVSALDANRVAVATVTPDLAFYLVNDLGDKLVYDFNSAGALEQAGGLLGALAGKSDGLMWASNAWLHRYPGAAKRFQLAMDEADVWMHNPSNQSQVLALLGAEHDLAAFEKGPQGRAFLKQALPSIISWMPTGSARAFMRFWVHAGVLSHPIPSSIWVSPTMPRSASQVVAAVRAAGLGSLGDSA
ncbi:ABC transporter substrate-binding protein [Aciditerrimonas ferrireducens]|jgi:ABC-type nitrate/sulfonate/bicarbonate transport system substrate-binding protein|uniref:ABC transporter substrate-binding protein n=1 Tax=Aciditerrimonas ferrireducens TaxID=667306 RepID=A0ABV6C2C5_9ACTN